MPVRAQLTSTTTSDARPVLELIDLRDNSVTVIGAIAENPQVTLVGTTRSNVPPRQIAVDRAGTAYVLTLSGMTVVPMTPAGVSRPLLAATSAVVNASDGGAVLAPGSFIAVNGQNLADSVKAGELPAPTLLGGSCLTFSDIAVPLISASGNQLLAQVPDDLAPGRYVAVVRSLATGQKSDGVIVTVR
jgi:hypothetical protein